MANIPARSRQIVVGFDDSSESHSALRWAARFAELIDATIEVITSWTSRGWVGLPSPPRAELDVHIERALDGVFGEQRPVGLTSRVPEGSAAAALVAASEHATLVVVGSRGHRPVAGWLLGSVSAQVAEHSRCPVLVVHNDPYAPGVTARPVVVGVDGSEGSRQALRWAAAVAHRQHTRLDAVTAWESPMTFASPGLPPYVYPQPDAEKDLANTVDETFGALRPADLQTLAVEGPPARVLVQLSEGADLVVVGSRGHGGFAGLLLGSVSAQVAERAQCSVLVVHGGEPDNWPTDPISGAT